MVLGIYGYGGLGREIYIIAKKIDALERRWERIIFVDDAEIKETKDPRHAVYSFEEAKERYREDLELVIGVGEPAVRELLYNKVKADGLRVATLIHPGVYIDETTEIGEGVVICEGCTVTCNVRIAENTYVQPHSMIGHDICIGKHCVISANTEIGGANVIGDRVYLGFLSGTKEGITIGSDTICSAGAIVFRSLPDNVIAVGNPARIMKRNEEKRVFK